MKYLKIFVAMLAIFSLSACLGDNDKVTKAPVVDPPIVVVVDDDDDDDEPPEEVAATFIEKANTLNRIKIAAIDGCWLCGDFFNANAGDLPTGGEANYAGVMQLPEPNVEDGRISGDMTMNINFAINHAVTGNVDNFSNSLDEVWSGNLVVSGELFEDMDLDGTLTSQAGLDTEFVAELTNFFVLSDTSPAAPEYLAGNLSGFMRTDGDSETINSDNSRFYVELTP